MSITCGNCGAVVPTADRSAERCSRCAGCGQMLEGSGDQQQRVSPLGVGNSAARDVSGLQQALANSGSQDAGVDAASAAAPSAAQLARPNPVELQALLLGAFQGQIEPIRTTAAYKLGVILVAAVMVLLVVIYLGLIAGVCYLVHRYALSPGLFLDRPGGIWLYLGVVVGGPVLLFFWSSRCLPRPRKRSAPARLCHSRNRCCSPLWS